MRYQLDQRYFLLDITCLMTAAWLLSPVNWSLSKKDIEKYKKVRTSLSYRNVWGVFRNMMNYIEFFNMGTPKSLLKKSANDWLGTKHELSYESDKIKSEYVHELKRVFEVLLALRYG